MLLSPKRPFLSLFFQYQILAMKPVRPLIGVLVTNEPFATQYFCNLFPPLQVAPVALRPDRPVLARAIAAGVTEKLFQILRCVPAVIRFRNMKSTGVA